MMTIEQFAERNGIGEERARQLCKAGRVLGARKIGDGRGGIWEIPAGATIVRTPAGRPRMIDAVQYPQLLAVMWDRKTKRVDARTACRLYELNAKWIEPDRMDGAERALFDDLVQRYGNGVFNA